jgi:hypothetical protein
VARWQLLSRRATTLRGDRMPFGTGVWRATPESLGARVTRRLGGPLRGFFGWMYRPVRVEMTVTGDRLTLVPVPSSRALGRFRACELRRDGSPGVLVGRVRQVAGAPARRRRPG